MITFYGQVAVDTETVRRLFEHTDAWPEWMDGITDSRVLRGDADGRELALKQRLHGMNFTQVLQCRFFSDRMETEQLREGIKRWKCDWHFSPAPQGEASTTLRCDIVMELGGMLGLLASRKQIHDFLEDTFNRTLAGLERQAAGLNPQARDETDAQAFLRLYETPEGLELWLEGKRYKLLPKD